MTQQATSNSQIRDAIERGQSGQLLPTAANEKEDDEEEGGG